MSGDGTYQRKKKIRLLLCFRSMGNKVKGCTLCRWWGWGSEKTYKEGKPEKSGVLCCNYQEEYRQFRWHKQGHLDHFLITGTRSMATMVKGANPNLVQVMLTSTFFLTLSAMLFSQCFGPSVSTVYWKHTFMVEATTPLKVSII